MDTNLLPSPVSGRILLLVAPDSLASDLFEMVARLALQSSLYILDGGNTFQGYSLARALHRYTHDIAGPMQRVMLSRAFTCYQMLALFESLLAGRDFAPHSLRPTAPEHGLPCPLRPAAPEHGLPCPVLVLDFLGIFYDQDVRMPERRRLLRGCIQRLQTLARRTPVAVWVRQRSAVPQEALGFLDIVRNAAGQVWYPPRHAVLPALKQAALFPSYRFANDMVIKEPKINADEHRIES